ncbi:hypothetical protein BHF71_10665 [Vulcanibacillus modesticaldus]|uniref:site-specific DNA-methyltransferase (cytosine-N(4)-specific) n=1 Tax=Vulcanibacillus modesticaldus TaxID=337097 RepID=A0A1D2YT33_9BACI|nr:hypothetical protein BHF71_10665 [Vulcanibacillus modesticaldus]
MDIIIYIKDSTKGMHEVSTASIDLIITSPPYWNLKNYENHPQQLGFGLTYRHFFEILKQNLIESMRVLKEDGIAVFIVGDIMESTRKR